MRKPPEKKLTDLTSSVKKNDRGLTLLGHVVSTALVVMSVFFCQQVFAPSALMSRNLGLESGICALCHWGLSDLSQATGESQIVFVAGEGLTWTFLYAPESCSAVDLVLSFVDFDCLREGGCIVRPDTAAALLHDEVAGMYPEIYVQ